MELFGFVISIETVEVFKHLLLAALLGSFLGIERVFAHKMAGVRTYALVSMGAALFIVISTSITPLYVDVTNFDPLRMAASVIVGIGFIGAGIIIFRDSRVRGLTTATGLWVAAGIGMASGFGLYAIAIFAAFITLIIFTVMWFFEQEIKKVSGDWDEDEP
ncbi:magnesium transporter MgtC [bacterium]|nr:magnesium transporter MgtC [bacterium]|tara:strand:+ start:1280 stop:1762 length:483 start_codon:yes stop_codon:yes gene_type:complete